MLPMVEVEVIATPNGLEPLPWAYNDGGRHHHFKGSAGDCVVRAIAITSGKPYMEVYQDLHGQIKEYSDTSWSKTAKKLQRKGKSKTPRDGVFSVVYKPYLERLGYTWIPCMAIGSGCKVHMAVGEVPTEGRYILRVSKHLAALIDGVIHDTYDSSREGTRCVYGMWKAP